MKFSKRTDWPAVSNALSQLVGSKRGRGEAVVDLTQSNPTRCSFKYLTALEPLSDPKNLVYDPDPHGLLEAREAVCRYCSSKGIQTVPEQIFLTSSTSEAYTFLLKLLVDYGQGVAAPQPSYPLLDYLCVLNDSSLERYALDYEKNWQVDRKRLQRIIKKNTRAVIVVNPNNPTGSFIHADEKEWLVDLCVQKGLAVISDEVFLDFAFDHRAITTFAGEDRVLSFTLSGISKILGLPQMKLSWIVVNGPEATRREAIRRLEIIADTFLSVNTPSQISLSPWMERLPQVQEEIMSCLETNRCFLRECFQFSKNARPLPLEGGWYAVLEVGAPLGGRPKRLGGHPPGLRPVRAGGVGPPLHDDEALAIYLLKDHGVLVHPGYFFDGFDAFDSKFLVLSLLARPEVFREGVGRLGKALDVI